MTGQAAEHDIRGVDDVPLTVDVSGLRAESAHSRSLYLWDLFRTRAWASPAARESAAPAARWPHAGRGIAGMLMLMDVR